MSARILVIPYYSIDERESLWRAVMEWAERESTQPDVVVAVPPDGPSGIPAGLSVKRMGLGASFMAASEARTSAVEELVATVQPDWVILLEPTHDLTWTVCRAAVLSDVSSRIGFFCEGAIEPELLQQPAPIHSGSVREPSAAWSVRASDPPGTSLSVAERMGVVAESVPMKEVCRAADILARHSVPVLLLGETGTGKSLLARYLHQSGPRKHAALVEQNCAALPQHLVESVLFGHQKGAFTGATADRAGLFSEADRGTLFLDEIGDLPMDQQSKLLRVLEDGTVRPVGGTESFQVDVRIVAATNRDLERDIQEGTFREDLFHRLGFGILRVPPLRERPEDIPALARAFLKKFNPSLAAPRRLSDKALHWLSQQTWPGNVRELENIVGRAALFSESPEIQPGQLEPSSMGAGDAPDLDLERVLDTGFQMDDFMRSVRLQLMETALRRCHGNQSAAARLLGVSPQAVSQYVHARKDEP